MIAMRDILEWLIILVVVIELPIVILWGIMYLVSLFWMRFFLFTELTMFIYLFCWVILIVLGFTCRDKTARGPDILGHYVDL